MRKVSACDSETDPFKAGRIPEPFIWGYYDGDTFESFRETWQFVEFVMDREEICYAHNGGKFDFFFLSEFLDLLEPLTVINGRIVRFKIGACEFRDSFAILPVPLASHDKGQIDYSLFESDVREQHMTEITDYLYRDCASLFQLVSRFVDEFGPTLTLASAALKKWAAISETKPPQTSAAHYSQFKPYYYGGRVECFRNGIIETPFKVADINSAYPFAMLSPHPCGTDYIVSDELPGSIEATARSFLRIRAESTGAFPWRGETLEFPADGKVREFFVTGHEFNAARDTGRLILDDVIEVYQWQDTISFTEYVNHFYSIKIVSSKGTGDYIIAKLFLNSCYGKFGANPENYEEYIICHPSDVDVLCERDGYCFADFFGPHAVLARPICDAAMRYYDVVIAASVTGLNRANLFRALVKCDGLIYCDTDSIDAENVSGLNYGDALGQWEIEADCDRGGVAGKKLYAFHDKNTDKWKTASKGVRFTAAEIMRVCAGESVTYANPVPSFSLKTGVRFIDRTIGMQ